jgi:hypothetical protein
MLCGELLPKLEALADNDRRRVYVNAEQIKYLEDRGLIESVKPEEKVSYERKLATYESLQGEINKLQESIENDNSRIQELADITSSKWNRFWAFWGLKDISREKGQHKNMLESVASKRQKAEKKQEEAEPLKELHNKYAGFKKTETDYLIRSINSQDLTEYLKINIDRLRNKDFDEARASYSLDRELAEHLINKDYEAAANVLRDTKGIKPDDLKSTLESNMVFSNYGDLISFLKVAEEEVFKGTEGKFFDFLMDMHQEEGDQAGTLALYREFPDRVRELETKDIMMGVLENNAEGREWNSFADNIKEYKQEVSKEELQEIIDNNIPDTINDDYLAALRTAIEEIFTDQDDRPCQYLLENCIENEYWTDAVQILDELSDAIPSETVEYAVKGILSHYIKEDITEATEILDKYSDKISAKDLNSCIDENLGENSWPDIDDLVEFLTKAAELRFKDYDGMPFDWIATYLCDNEEDYDATLRVLEEFPGHIEKETANKLAGFIFGKKIKDNEFEEAKEITQKHKMEVKTYFSQLDDNLAEDSWPDNDELITFLKETLPEQTEGQPLDWIPTYVHESEEDSEQALRYVEEFPDFIAAETKTAIVEGRLIKLVEDAEFKDATSVLENHGEHVKKADDISDSYWAGGNPEVDTDVIQFLQECATRYYKDSSDAYDWIVEGHMNDEEYDDAQEIVDNFPNLVSDTQKKSLQEAKEEEDE